MFDGLPQDQFHQFIASRRPNNPPSLPLVPLPLSPFPLHTPTITSHNSQATNFITTPNSFDTTYSHHHHHNLFVPLQQHEFLHHHTTALHHNKNITNNNAIVNNQHKEVDDEMARERSIAIDADNDAWTNDEVLALLRIRSTMENWFPDFTWEHVSRKLAELGFKIRSGEKCKEKFEEESRYFTNINNNNNNCTKSFRPFLSELEELYNHTHHNTPQQNHDNNNTTTTTTNNNDHDGSVIGSQKNHTPVMETIDNNPTESEDKRVLEDQTNDEIFGEEESTIKEVLEVTTTRTDDVSKKRKRVVSTSTTSSSSQRQRHDEEISKSNKFEMLKGFCEEIVNKMMAQQEEMHNKLLEDMVKRDQEKLRKEEAWKKNEMDRINKELDTMAREQAVAGDRQASIIEFLRKFSNDPKKSSAKKVLVKTTRIDDPVVSLAYSSSLVQSLSHKKSPSSNNNNNDNDNNEISAKQYSSEQQQNPSSLIINTLLPTNPSTTHGTPLMNSNVVAEENKADLGKRWSRDEVLALINLRCSLYNADHHHHHHHQDQKSDGSNKAIPLWERISQGMSEMGFKRSAKRCKEKWENINKYFRKTKDANKKRSVDSRTCPYFHQLSTLYNKGTLVVGENNNDYSNNDQEDYHQQQRYSSSDQGHINPDDHQRVAQGESSEPTTITITTTNNNVVPPAFDFEF